jgi:hypothetical protein
MSSSDEEQLMTWQQDQGHIVSGGGELFKFSVLNRDYSVSDLPHYLLENKISRKTFATWLSSNRRSNLLMGCWGRPIFAGGWKESSSHDTVVFNLQTPSFFIDMRIPNLRPSEQLKHINSAKDCTDHQLRVLSRQHCFAGYTLHELPSDVPSPLLDPSTPIFTRHHVIDWNYHPVFPRPRPNRWFVEINADHSSFKEICPIRNENQVPIYFERWQKHLPLTNEESKYLALRKHRPCPKALAAEGRVATKAERVDAVMVIVGCHFALCVDRDYDMLLQYLQTRGDEVKNGCKGGGGMFVDYLLQQNQNAKEEDNEELKTLKRQLAEEYVSLQGCYGMITTNASTGVYEWRIIKSTFPWLEGKMLFQDDDYFDFDGIGGMNSSVFGFVGNSNGTATGAASLRWSRTSLRKEHECCLGSWEVLENNYPVEELESLFPGRKQTFRTRSAL